MTDCHTDYTWDDKIENAVDDAHKGCASGVRSLQDKVRNFNWKNFIKSPYLFLLIWLICGILAITIPRKHWRNDRDLFYQRYGYWIEYENNQRMYEEAQKNNDDNNNNNNNNQYAYANKYYTALSADCQWYQYKCIQRREEAVQYYMYQNGNGNNNNNNNNNNENNIELPNWYRWISGRETEEEARQKEEMYEKMFGKNYVNQNNGSTTDESCPIHFVYNYMILMFVAMLLHGVVISIRNKPSNGLRLALLMYGQFAALILLLCGQGVLMTDNRDLEDSIYGFYGQMGVLIIYTCVYMIIFCFIFFVVFSIRAWLVARFEIEQNQNNNNRIEYDTNKTTAHNIGTSSTDNNNTLTQFIDTLKSYIPKKESNNRKPNLSLFTEDGKKTSGLDNNWYYMPEGGVTPVNHGTMA